MNYCFSYKFNITSFYTFTKLVCDLHILWETKIKERQRQLNYKNIESQKNQGWECHWASGKMVEVGAGKP